jgi:2-polyprenyl-3-methyl-5-hydroxy-6-metoxy-1,4-benzoquinol methylase
MERQRLEGDRMSVTQEQLVKVRSLNYDHHYRMTVIHEQRVSQGIAPAQADLDAISYRTLLNRVPSGRSWILELGAAAGSQFPLLSEWLAPNGSILGIDLYEPAVVAAQENGLQVDLGYVETLPYKDDSFDLVCSRHVMEHLIDLPTGLAQIMRVTQPGGYIAHVTPNMAVDNEPAHLNHRDGSGWRAEWEAAGLLVISVERHPFNGGEIHMIGRKP